jgi:hypothetical protein
MRLCVRWRLLLQEVLPIHPPRWSRRHRSAERVGSRASFGCRLPRSRPAAMLPPSFPALSIPWIHLSGLRISSVVFQSSIVDHDTSSRHFAIFPSEGPTFPHNPFSLLRISQVKTDLIRQREVELLIPAAGPDASEVFHLLRPATPKLAKLPPPMQAAERGGESQPEPSLIEKPAEQLPPAKPRRKLMSSLSFLPIEGSMAAAAAAAAAAFSGSVGPATGEQRRQAAPQVGPRTLRSSQASIMAEHLIGLSCAICEHGEVILLPFIHFFSRDAFFCQHR